MVTAGMRGFPDFEKRIGPNTKRRPPMLFRLVFFGTPLLMLVGIAYALRRWLRRNTTA